MPATNRPLKTSQGIGIPQYFNEEIDDFEAITGLYGANRFIERGRIVKDSFSGTTSQEFSYGEPMYGLTIVNDGETDVILDVNDISIVLKAGESFDDLFDEFNLFNVTATGPYRVVVRA